MKRFTATLLLSAFLILVLSCGSKHTKGNTGEKVENRDESFEPIQLTFGPKQHWFGYYDKQQMDLTGRYILGMEVDTIFRSPTSDDTVKIGMVDLQDNNRWIELGTSNAWGWQQGCMLQWIPGSPEEIIWNDIQDGNIHKSHPEY